MFFYSLRAIAIEQPEFVVIEQPRGIINNGLRTVLGGLRMVQYSWEDPEIISAAELGAPHERERLFIIAYPNDFQRGADRLARTENKKLKNGTIATYLS